VKNKKLLGYLLFISLLFIPSMVYASSGSGMSIEIALFMEAFCSIHMSFFVLRPLAYLISADNHKTVFWTLFFIRIGVLLFFDFFVSPGIAFFDFIGIFPLCFFVIPILCAIKRVSWGSVLSAPSASAIASLKPKGDNALYSLSEDQLLEDFIKKELDKIGFQGSNMVAADQIKRKNILSLIFDVLLAFYICTIFFHFPLATYVLGAIVLIVLYCLFNRYDFMKYLKKEIKSRPDEKISNIVMSVTSSLTKDNLKIVRIAMFLVAIVVPILAFKNPVILYEKSTWGYNVRFYAFGWNEYKTAEIPATYKGEPIVGLRGNAFSNMPFLEKVKLPDTITEIRGQAFKNDTKLTSVNLPAQLKYLGGGAFYNCKSLQTIELPEGLTELGGEAFYNATSLRQINLPERLTEIRGDTFNNCYSLTSIKIPDAVTRIGGHAFYGNSSLSNVTISKDSQLNEIGSSAFRMCSSLKEITIPKGVSVNERAFKESPTIIYTYNDNGGVDVYNSYNSYNSYGNYYTTTQQWYGA